MKRRNILLQLVTILLFFMSNNNTYAKKRKYWLSHTPTTQQDSRIYKKPTLALFDTSKQEKHAYNPFIEIAKSAHFDVTYHPISKIIDYPNEEILQENIDCACFIMCPEFLKTMETSPISRKILSIMKLFSQKPHKTTILMFPSLSIRHPNPISTLSTLFDNANLAHVHNRSDHQSQVTFYKLTNRFLQLPIESRPITYHTTLKLPGGGQPFGVNQEIQTPAKIALLPIRQDYPTSVKNLFPFGIYYFNPSHNNHTVITNAGLLFSCIEENFKLCPIDFLLRRHMHDALHEMMWEINQIATQNTSIKGINTQRILRSQKNNVPETIASIGFTTENNYKLKANKVAWMELNPFSPINKDKNKIKQQDQMVQFILESGLDHLWITLNPNMYYSPIGKLKNQQNHFLTKLSTFTKKLAYAAKKQRITPPKILIGFEIVNNIHKPNLPQQPAHDLYGNPYPDIPRPLSSAFWENEIANPLYTFLQKWKKSKISNGIQLGGIVLDLEMYERKTVGSYLATMGFEQKTITQYLKPPLLHSVNPENFSQYLMDNNLSTHYFVHLEHKAEQLGNRLRNFFNTQLPNGVIGCYAPNISVDWFYKGFYKGLSTPKKPISLFSFNTEFQSHKEWLEKNDIHVNHLSVLMMSKIRNKKEYKKLVENILKHHNGGIWINRFSRLVEKFNPSHWSFLEQTPMNMKERYTFAKFLRNSRPQPMVVR